MKLSVMKHGVFCWLFLFLGCQDGWANQAVISELTDNNSVSFFSQINVESRPVVNEKSWHIPLEDAKKLLKASIGESVVVKKLPSDLIVVGDKNSNEFENVELSRYEIFAPNAKIHVVSEHGAQVLSVPRTQAFQSVKQGIGLLVDPLTGDVNGIMNRAGVTLEISGNLQTGLDFRKNNVGKDQNEVTQQCHTSMKEQPGDPLADVKKAMSSKTIENRQLGGTMYETVVAVDTDNEWMAGKGNSTTVAMNYITGLFTNMNVYYERDVSLRLLIGDVFLRVSTDPYPTESNINSYLTDFGEYWRVNNGSINRDFAMMLSGQNISSNSYSGIAWLNQYCENGFVFSGQTAGSYSINRIGTNLSVGFSSQFVAHELGHNLGSPHTHCYSPAVDFCFNGESGCYSGAVSCPAGGKGTIMSYCHFGAPSGAGCGTSDEEFHPTVISLLSSNVVSNNPSCIQSLGSDLIFENGFE